MTVPGFPVNRAPDQALRCPLCGSEAKSIRFFGLDATRRWRYAGFVTAWFVVGEVLVGVILARFVGLSDVTIGFITGLPAFVLLLAVSEVTRFALAYVLLWPLAIHVRHRGPHDWVADSLFGLALVGIAMLPSSWFMLCLP